MNSDLYFDGKQYISSSRAAKISGYVNDYIGQLCRDGKLECRMVGRSWYVSLESLISHKESNGGNVKSRARKNIPANTIPEILNSESSKISLEKVSSRVAIDDEAFITVSNEGDITTADEIEIPVNIFVEPQRQNQDSNSIFSPVVNDNLNPVSVKFTYHNTFEKKFPRLVGLTIAFLFAVSAFGSLVSSNYQTQLAYKEVANSFEEIFSVISNNNYLFASVSKNTRSSFDSFAVNFYETVNDVLFDTQAQILVLLGREKVPVDTSPHIAQAPQNSSDGQGMVVVPVDEKTNQDAVIAKIKDSFSDDVQVVPKQDGTSGVITPVFKRATNDNYLYVLVPIKN